MNKMVQVAAEEAAYIDEITIMLRDLLRQVIRLREPSVLSVIDEPEEAAGIPPHLEHALQAIGIWLQLLNIAEENAAIRNRRQYEKQGGPYGDGVTCPMPFRRLPPSAWPPKMSRRLWTRLTFSPPSRRIPTEAKRVTVLEIHRRIYLKLYELESPRWTPRERKALVDPLRNEIDLCG